jgi:hypothetical protein
LALSDWAEDYVRAVLTTSNSAQAGKLWQQGDLCSDERQRRFHAA